MNYEFFFAAYQHLIKINNKTFHFWQLILNAKVFIETYSKTNKTFRSTLFLDALVKVSSHLSFAFQGLLFEKVLFSRTFVDFVVFSNLREFTRFFHQFVKIN